MEGKRTRWYHRRVAITRLVVALAQLTIHNTATKEWLLNQLRQIKSDLDYLIKSVENENEGEG